ncbi:MAG: hypothetical protein IJ589_05790 [Lachnospiraceae bacterium]|nr:hypothetical protein [Lachnospiraceae bacterium]
MNTDIRIYNFKTGETATEKATAIIHTTDGRILAIGNEVFDNPRIAAYLPIHPEDQVVSLVEGGRIMNEEYMEAALKYFNTTHVFDGKRPILRPKAGVVVYHGYKDEATEVAYAAMLERIMYRDVLVYTADEISQGYSSVEEAIWALGQRNRDIRGAFEIF